VKDLWTASADYRANFQTDGEIATVLSLLELDGASALADVGCGNGAFALAAARRYPRCKVWAFDALQSAVDHCKSAAAELSGQQFHCGVAGAESIPVPDASVDRVLCRAVLHHIADAPAAYAQFARVLAPGGLLLLQAPANVWEKRWGGVISDLYMLMDDSHRRQYHRPGEIIAALSEVGVSLRRADC
jgi:ubiquinone/menaquinone biosynthesis C-methylase UbiE